MHFLCRSEEAVRASNRTDVLRPAALSADGTHMRVLQLYHIYLSGNQGGNTSRLCVSEINWVLRLPCTELIPCCCSACVIRAQWTGLNNSTLPAAHLSHSLSFHRPSLQPEFTGCAGGWRLDRAWSANQRKPSAHTQGRLLKGLKIHLLHAIRLS